MKNHGFTLMEVMIALLILGMVISVIWASFSNTIESKDYVETGNELYHSARWALDRMSRDLASAYVYRDVVHNSAFIGISHDSGDGSPMDELHFTSFAHEKLRANSAESDQCEISYFVMLDPDTGKNILYRREDPYIDTEPMSGGESLELVDNVLSLNFRYFNGNEWVDEWDSRNFDKIEKRKERLDMIGASQQSTEEDKTLGPTSSSSTEERVVQQEDDMVDVQPMAVEIALVIGIPDPNGGFKAVTLATRVKMELSTIEPQKEGDDDTTNEDHAGKSKKAAGASGSTSTGLSGGSH